MVKLVDLLDDAKKRCKAALEERGVLYVFMYLWYMAFWLNFFSACMSLLVIASLL